MVDWIKTKDMSTATTDRTMELAKEILNQINTIDRWFLPAVGAYNFAAVAQKDGFIGGLEFKVNGLKHKGWVKIRLTWADEYEISFVNRNREVVKTVGGVFCDELVAVLDFVEKG
jgi:hypothetical protein